MSLTPGRFVRIQFSHRKQAPKARSGHACVADNANLFMYGGYNNRLGLSANINAVFPELWMFNIATQKWHLIDTPGTPEHAASASLKLWNKKLFLYGGTGYPFGDEMSNIVHICHIDEDFRWETIKTQPATKDTSCYTINEEANHLPLKAYGQGIINYKGDVYVFGGAIGLYLNPVNHLHRLHFSKEGAKWDRVWTKGEIPLGRYKAEVILHPDKTRFYVLGGGSLYGSQSLKRLHCYCFETHEWSLQDTHPDSSLGIYPPGRAAFGCVQHDDLVIISGGRHYNEEESEALQDTWSFDLTKLQWTKLGLTLPMPLYFHSMALNPNGELFVFGGVINDIRIGDLYHAQIFIPKLSELCWKKYTKSFKKPEHINPKTLMAHGVPYNFIERLPRFRSSRRRSKVTKCDPS